MSTSTANVNPLNIQLSPMRVSAGLALNSIVDLGGTEGGVTISPKVETADIMVDQFGKTPIDSVVSGYAFTIKFILSEVKNKDLWKIAYPSFSEIVNGGTKSIAALMNIGDHLLPKALTWVLHPLENADSDKSSDYTIYKAVCTQASEVKYGPDKQTGISVELKVFPDLTTSPAKFMTIGDPANGMTNATAAAAIAGSNTGNGTISAEAVFNGVTKSETITILCLDAVSGNNFFVSGSQSGALGYCHVGAVSGNTVNFVPQSGSPQVITFTINQGSTQFVAGDSFTIATVASNFA